MNTVVDVVESKDDEWNSQRLLRPGDGLACRVRVLSIKTNKVRDVIMIVEYAERTKLTKSGQQGSRHNLFYPPSRKRL
jgi:hypothetical protein